MTSPVYIVRSERVGLGTPNIEGLETITRWFQNLETTAYLGQFGLAGTVPDEKAWLERAMAPDRDQAQFFIYSLPDGRHIGNGGLFNFTRSATATLGIVIGEPDAWGKGYGAEAVKLIVQYGMFFRNLHAVNLRVIGFNERAKRAYEKAGFHVAGRLRGAVLLGHERFDELIMDITREEVDLTAMRALIGQLAKP